jgi:hypothetical protein
MKASIILGFILAVLVTPVQAQTPKPEPLNINGNIFDPEPPQASVAPPAMKVKPANHVRKHRVRSST